MPKKEIITEIEGRKLKLSNLNKPLYPDAGIVKAEVIQYYLQIAPYILPHLINRPLTLIRYPEGVQDHRFYSKNKPNWTPEWIESIKLAEDDGNIYVMANNTPSLIWMANLAALELHPMQTTSIEQNRPDHFIFDLDPPGSADFNIVQELALRLKPFIESYGYQPFIKTSGSKGLHIYVPIKPIYDQSEVIETVKTLAKEYVKSDKQTTLKTNKEKRKGKVLLDIYRNHKSQTCVAPYSTRGKKGAPISAPIYWEELKSLKTSGTFTLKNILAKLEMDGDPWAKFRNSATPLHSDNRTSHSIISTSIVVKRIKGEKAAIEKIELKPMLATLGSKIPPKNKYSFEIKWDGIRIVIIKHHDQVSIISRKGNNLSDKFPEIVENIKDQLVDSFIVDGELVVLDSNGTPNFTKIVRRMHLNGKETIKRASKRDHINAYLFDMMYFKGNDIRKESLEYRRMSLENNIVWNDHIKFSSTFEDGSELLEAIKAKNMEGIMCKLKGSRYESNIRSTSWIKIKLQYEDDALIIGYTKGKGDRSKLFGALHLAKSNNNRFDYRGKIGTGFNQIKMMKIFNLLSKLDSTKKQIREKVDEERNTIWIDPVYSCKLKYASMSSNNTYREPVFLTIYKTPV